MGASSFADPSRPKERALANRRLREFLDKITKLTDVSGGARVTFAEFSERWMKTIEAQLKRSSATRRRSSLNNLLPVFGTLPVRNITTRMCEEWMHKRVGIASIKWTEKRRIIFDRFGVRCSRTADLNPSGSKRDTCTELRRRFTQFLFLQLKAPRTVDAYVSWIHNLAAFHRRSPD